VVNGPVISGFTPSSGRVGTSVTISGSGFTGATAVAFNGTSASFTVSSDTAIQTTVPAGATSGPISVTTPGGTATSSGSFTVGNGPGISGFTPASGPAGTSVTISGSGFTGATAVAFNGNERELHGVLRYRHPDLGTGRSHSGPISVTTPGGTATSPSAFSVVKPPAISGFSPASGTAGTSVTISGTGFSGATAVAFNGTSATFTVPPIPHPDLGPCGSHERAFERDHTWRHGDQLRRVHRAEGAGDLQLHAYNRTGGH